MARTIPAPSLSIAADESADALAMLGGTGSQINVYRIQPNGKRAFARIFTAEEFSEAAVAELFGGGAYFAQVRNADGTIGPGRSFDIDAAIRPTRRIQAAEAPPTAYTMGAYQQQQPADPVAAALATIMQRLERIEQGREPSPQQPTWRDMMDLVRQQQPAAQTTGGMAEILKMLPTFLEMVKPKSTIGELAEAMKLMRNVNRSGMNDGPDEPAGDSGLMGILNSPLGAAIAGKLMEPSAPRAPQPQQPAAVRATVQAPSSLPASPPTPPAPTTPAMPAPLAGALTQAAPLLLAALQMPTPPSAAEIAEGVLSSVPDMDDAAMAAALDGMPDGALAIAVIQAEPQLQPYAAKLIVAEGVLREMVRTDPADVGDEEPHTTSEPVAPAAPQVLAQPPAPAPAPTVEAPAPPPVPPAKLNGTKPKKGKK